MLRCFGVAFVMTIKINTLHGLSRRSSSPDRPPVSRELPPDGHKVMVNIVICSSSSWSSSYSLLPLIVTIIIIQWGELPTSTKKLTLENSLLTTQALLACRSTSIITCIESSKSFAKIKLYLKSKLIFCHCCASLTSKFPIFLLCVCNNEDYIWWYFSTFGGLLGTRSWTAFIAHV